MYFSGCPDDRSFGPSVHGCRDDFDFTIRFERIFFSLVPASLFIFFALARVFVLSRSPSIVGGQALRGLKVATIVSYSVLHLALLILSSTSNTPSNLIIASSVLGFLSSITIFGTSFLEHSRSPRPSILLNAYLFLTILFDTAQTRTIWLASVTPKDLVFSQLFTASVALKVVILVLESQNKERWIGWDVKAHSPEETSGIFSLSAFVWLNAVFLAGYRRVISIEDLFALDQHMATEGLQLKLITNLNSHPKGQKHGLGLAKALARTLTVPMLLPIPPRLARTAFKFCQPFLIHTLLDYLKKPEGSTSKNLGYGLIGATIVIYTGIASSNALYWYFHERTLTMSRGALAGAVYRKTTEVKCSAAGDSAALTLMSTDVERIRIGFLNMHEFWANTIEVALASWLLYRQLGVAFVAPLIVVIFCIGCAAFLNRYTPQRQKAWMSKIQKRVGLTANVISNMKHLKISGLTGPVEKLIQQMRVDELKMASRFRTIYVTVITVGYTPMALCPVITFAVTSRTLDVTTIFTSLSYLLLLADPLGYLFQNLPNLIAAFACLDRIQTFLEKDPRLDFRTSERKPSSRSDDSETETSEHENMIKKTASAITISDGNFGWEINKTSLNNININILFGNLTMVVGPIGSGKSTFCKALLGEIPVSSGFVSLNSYFATRRIGFCDQIPYLTNATIRENVIGFSPFNMERYREVIEATMLQPDLSILPKGDETNIGSSGVSLSGGQKQRVQMARALYLETDFFVFDDIMSGLDADTEEQVFRRVFGINGLLRRRNATVVLCTHTVRHLASADHIIALGMDGTVVEQGTFNHLIQNEMYVQSLGVKASDDFESAASSGAVHIQSPDSIKSETIPVEPIPFTKEEAKVRMLGDSKVYGYYLRSLGWFSITAFTVFGLSWGFFYNWGNIWLTYWSNDVSSAHPSRSNGFYIGLYAVFQFAFIASLFFVFIICFRTMIATSGAKLHKAALSTVISAPLSFFATTDTGLVTNLFSQDMTLIDNELPLALTNLALDTFNALGMAAVIATSSPFLAITYPPIAIILYIIQKFYLRTSRQLRLLDLEAKSPMYTHFLDTINGIATFRAFGWVQQGIDLNNHLLNRSQRPTFLLAMVQRWLGFTLQIVVAILAVVCVAMATQLRSSTALTGASLITLMTFGDNLNYIIRWYTQIETSIGAVSRLKAFSQKVKSESLDGEDVVPPESWPSHGAVHINGVSASYGVIRDEKAALALNNLNISIQPGEKVAICGRSGSGKSSTLLLLLRLLEPIDSCSQNITIDDIPLHKIDRSTLRQRLIAVPQDPVFLPDGTSVIENLDPYNVSTEPDCQAVLETVGLWNVIGKRGGLRGSLAGDTLSQGQKQLFSLARAILRRRVRSQGSPLVGPGSVNESEGKGGNGILLLDEVSSSVDQATDRDMQRIIREEFVGYTIIMVSHRLEMVMGFDTVLVMAKGAVVEAGPPKVLIDTEGSRFKELWMVGNK